MVYVFEYPRTAAALLCMLTALVRRILFINIKHQTAIIRLWNDTVLFSYRAAGSNITTMYSSNTGDRNNYC